MLSFDILADDADNEQVKRLFGLEAYRGMAMTVSNDDSILGALCYYITADLAAHISAVFVSPEYRHIGYGDFLTRSAMNSFTLNGMSVVIDYADTGNYFAKFGFADTDGVLSVSPEDIVFPSKCKH